MIVTVSIREENTEEQCSVSASVAVPALATQLEVVLAMGDASADALRNAIAKGWVA